MSGLLTLTVNATCGLTPATPAAQCLQEEELQTSDQGQACCYTCTGVLQTEIRAWHVGGDSQRPYNIIQWNKGTPTPLPENCASNCFDLLEVSLSISSRTNSLTFFYFQSFPVTNSHSFLLPLLSICQDPFSCVHLPLHPDVSFFRFSPLCVSESSPSLNQLVF